MHARILAPALVAGLLVACGGSPKPASAPKPTPTAAAQLRADQLRRSDVLATLSTGMGAFLQVVTIEPKLVKGKFRGHRIVSINDATGAWDKVDLKPGDVVLDVNGLPIDLPEHAMVPWRQLALAKQLSVHIERDGVEKTVVWEIVEDASSSLAATPKPAAAAASTASPPPVAVAPPAAPPAASSVAPKPAPSAMPAPSAAPAR